MTCTSASLAPTATAGAPSACATATWPRRGPSPRRTSSSPSRTTASRWTTSRCCSRRRGWGRDPRATDFTDVTELDFLPPGLAKDEAPALERGEPEVDEQARRKARRSQVVDDLGFIKLVQAAMRFQLDEHTIVTDEVSPVVSHVFTLVRQFEGDLPTTADPSMTELNGHGPLVHGLQVPWPKHAMHFHGRANDRVRAGVMFVGHLCSDAVGRISKPAPPN